MPAPAPSPARIATVELAQSLLYPSGDAGLVLVADKAVLVKVNATTPTPVPAQANPAGTLRVETAAGVLVQSIALNVPLEALPASVPAVPRLADSYSAVVPAALVKSGLRLSISLANGQPPVVINPRVGGGVALRIVAVPVRIADTTGQVTANVNRYVQDRMPMASVTVETRAPYVSRRVTSLPAESGWGSAFSAILGEINDLYLLESGSQSNTYYYGFVPKRSFGIVGIGYRPGHASLGFDLPDNPIPVLETLTHELGHNLNLPHAPCGGASGADPQYPYANAQLGGPGRYIWGFLASANTFVDPRRTDVHDLMSYCNGNTFSDYNYRALQVYLTPTDRFERSGEVAAKVSAGPQELLLVSGQINPGRAVLTPVKTLFGEARLPKDGPYLLRILTAQGTVEHRFAPLQVDHQPEVQHFGFTIPHPGPILGMSILKDGVVLMDTTARPPAAAAAAGPTASGSRLLAANRRPQVQVSEQSGALRLSWDAGTHPYLTVTHVGGGAKRTTLAQDLQGGSASLPSAGLPSGGHLEFSLSDGLNSVRVTQQR